MAAPKRKATGPLPKHYVVAQIFVAICDERGLTFQEASYALNHAQLTLNMRAPARTAAVYNEKVHFSR